MSTKYKPIAERRNQVFNWVVERFDEVERLLEWCSDTHQVNMRFKDENHFIQTQRKYVDRYNGKNIGQLEQLMRFCDSIGMMDCESMVVFKASGFIFDLAGEIVIHHPR